ncbi:MAG TPA: helix-turn-helix domain-containing protein [Dermatophilaceae bacterium]|nr:helix-turn-helix domain-containing protein [Dermatophilaceae bacterium]
MATDRLEELFAVYGTHLSIEDLAEIFGVAPPTVYRWLRTGVIPAYKTGTTWVVLRDEVRDWMETQRNQ